MLPACAYISCPRRWLELANLAPIRIMGGGGDDAGKPVAAMVVVQVVFAGVNIVYKLAVSDGMDMRVLVAYRYLFASAFLAPLAYFIER